MLWAILITLLFILVLVLLGLLTMNNLLERIDGHLDRIYYAIANHK